MTSLVGSYFKILSKHPDNLRNVCGLMEDVVKLHDGPGNLVVPLVGTNRQTGADNVLEKRGLATNLRSNYNHFTSIDLALAINASAFFVNAESLPATKPSIIRSLFTAFVDWSFSKFVFMLSSNLARLASVLFLIS